MQAVISEDSLVGINDPAGRGISDRGATEDVCGQRNVENLRQRATGKPADTPGDTPGRVVAGRNPAWVRLTVTLPAGESGAAEQTPPSGDRERIVPRLHDQ